LRILRKLAAVVEHGSPRLLTALESLSDEMNGSKRSGTARKNTRPPHR